MADADADAAPVLVTTRDGFFGGRLLLAQPAKGHRSGTDAVLLAAAVPQDFAGLVYDVGAGVGAVGLGAALLAPAARVRLVERDPVAARLAADNVDANQLGERVSVVAADVLALARHRHVREPADFIVTNPPFHEAARSRASPFEARRTAHVLDPHVSTTDWLRACLNLLAPKATLVLVQRPSALPEVLAALARRAGGIVLKSVHPRAGEPASRILIRAVKGSHAPMSIAAPLVLHDDRGFTAEADRLHKGLVALAW